jgi:hypothetical protein
MTASKVSELFASDIYRRIEEVIKVDQVDDQIVRDELKEYVVTNSICKHYAEILERYQETPNKRHEGIGIWVSGFFGSGKSSFAKYLGFALENRNLLGESAAQLFGQRTGDPRVQVILKTISEKIPTHAVIFDVSTDRGIRTGNQTITEIMYRLFLQSLGYARDLDLSELEITLEEANELTVFKAKYQELFNKNWDEQKGKIAIAVQQASRVMHELDPITYPTVDSWRKPALGRSDVTPGSLAERCIELMLRRYPDHNLVFVIDEVGQFVARDVQKMLDLQAVVQSLGRVGQGRLWLVVTSQEKLTELVGGLDDRRVELARLMDRFPLQVHLEPSDISEVTSKRVLSKNAAAEEQLREVFTQHRGRLSSHTRLSADIRLPELTTESFVDLYPLLPYQVDLIINVVSGLRTQGGASKHVGGANRTIIKLAQQLLVHPDVKLAEEPVGSLARIDQIYNLVSGNIDSEIRSKIDEIPHQVDHPLAQKVAKAICLLQYVRSIRRTAENIAAALHPSVDSDSQLPEVKAALEALVKAHKVRLGDDGYRIPSPVEDDWERQRNTFLPKPADVSRAYGEAVKSFWQPQPTHTFLDTKLFKAGLYLNGRQEEEGDVPFHITLAESPKDYSSALEEMRRRSQAEPKSVFWVVELAEGVYQEAVELARSKEILSTKERTAKTKAETALVSEEKGRQRKHQEEVKRLIKQSLLAGTIFFRGNDRSPDSQVTEPSKAAANVLAQSLPEIFDRFEEGAVKPQEAKKALEAVLTTENLRGLSSSVFTDLNLLRDQGGKPVFYAEGGPLAEILARIENRTSYGEVASGRYLADEFGGEPFGWDFDAVRLFVVALLRSGKIEATSKGQAIENALSIEARNTFTNNNLFRQASFRPKVGIDFEQVVKAYEHYQDVFGRDVPELEQSVVANAIRTEVELSEEEVQSVHALLIQHNLPGREVLRSAIDEMKTIRTGNEERAIQTFNASHKQLKEAIKRSAELSNALTEPRLHDLHRARQVLEKIETYLKEEPDQQVDYEEQLNRLNDLLQRESFFKGFADIDQTTRALGERYKKQHDAALAARTTAYTEALAQLKAIPGWEQLDTDQQERVAKTLASRAKVEEASGLSIPMLREQETACSGLLNKAISEMFEILDGSRLERVNLSSYFAGGIETEEQLDAALTGLRDHCVELLGAGKKILMQ